MRKWLLLAAAGLIAPAFAEVPIYTLGSPRPAQIRDVGDPERNVWLASNAVFVATAGFSAVDVANEQVNATGMDVLLVEAEIGFSWERAKPEYYLSDRIDAPANVDWNATYNRYCELTAENGGVSGFLFNTDGNDPGIFATTGGSQTFEWILQDGSTNKMTYTVAMSGSGRPRRIYWTDSPYNAPPISLSGKFVKFMGNAELLTLRYGTETNITGGVAQETKNKIVSGLYVDPESQVLYAAGRLSGQCVMVYYDTGSYSNILAVQVVEVRKPEAIARRGVIGEALRPDGQGYPIEGLVPRVATGIGDATDNRGNYLYQHTGRHSYSPKHNAVFPLRPTVGERWLASIYWMETDAMGVQWPFEYDQYENDWPKDGQIYVRGDVQDANGARDYGAKIHLDKVYTAELQKYQEPEGHAMAVEGDNSFYTKGEGWSLLRLEAEDNIWFLPIHSILRSNTDYYTLKSSRITVGRELTLRSGSRSGTSSGAYFSAVRDIAGYIYKPVSAQTYDVNLYYENQGNMTTNTASSGSSTSTTKAPSAIYAIAADGKTIEVWWSERARIGPDAPAEITVPVLPQVYRPIWPEANEMPQIVIASQQGSANETIYQQNGAAYFDRRHALLRLANCRYFPAGEGTISFWTRTGMHDEGGEETINQPSALMWLGLELESDKDGYGLSPLSIAVETNRQLVVRSLGEVLLAAPMPAVERVNEWTHIALTFNAACATLYLDGEAATNCVNNTLAPRLAKFLEENVVGANPALAPTDASAGVAEGREVAEIVFRSRALTAEEIASSRYTILSGKEANLTGYYTFRMGIDLNPIIQNNQFDLRSFFERVHGEECGAINVAYVEPGAPARGTGVIAADEAPTIYRQNDPSKPGYNPNEEHALVLPGSGGYVTWALRTDLNEDGAPPPAAFVEYTSGGRSCLQMYEVVLTNDVWKTLGADCTAGRALPGPHPFDIFENPWLEEDFWDSAQGKPGVAYRDRKGQIWARAAGTLGFHKYYAMQDGFDFPQLTAAQQPDVGDPIPWLALLDRQTGQETDPLVAKPATWTWNVLWPENVPEMRIGQTLTTAADGLPEVWNAKSMAVVYPDPNEVEDVVLLTDPTVMQSVPLAFDVLQKLGFSTDKNGGLTTKGGKYYFTELPPHLSKRLYFDSTNGKLCFIGERESSAAGATILYPNVLSRQDRDKVLELVPDDVAAAEAAAYATWGIAVNQLARCAVRPCTATIASSEIRMVYAPVDHYALTAMGGTNYVTLIENDATNAVMGVTAGDPINMHVFKVVPKYYKGRIVTREDEINLLSQQLTVLYTEAFGGEADGFDFEWRKARPNADGTVPMAYDELGIYSRRYDPDATTLGYGNVRLTIGEQGDTLANMVNTYWICRYRATTNSPAYRTMGSAWSEWCAPPALAEGWVQRVLNNITPFNQRMTDLYENKVETPISMIQIAGRPYTGDVALNQDNMTSVGLIELYETILNKAESLSLALGINDTDANKQLLLAVERLQDLYALLGDEAYADAKNPTIGIGSNKAFDGDNQPEVDVAQLSSALFCFDNQVPSLLDEELALLRGRSGESAPVVTMAPYYNRLLWNFTKGITAGEVAYAVNYNIEGTEKTVLGEEQAAVLYPQGHGDAYGHYLSALKGWYRLIRNPCFSWPVAQGEMVVADSTVNVDYYEEAKFSEAAAKLAKTAADCVDLTARKAWRDNGGSSGYLDEDDARAFGYGEWAVRGGYGSLVNWVTANSLLPIDANKLDEAEFNEVFKDGALSRIDRGTVDELAEICTQAERVQRQLDELDAGMNPLGLSDSAIAFDITPIGASDGTQTHYEQIRERAATALGNARKVLDVAQENANRLRMLQEANDSYEDAIAAQEAAFEKELIGYYGTPYSDDIGPGGTYVQGYEGPDLIHYMWMDLAKFGLSDLPDTQTSTLTYYSGLTKLRHWYNVFAALGDNVSRELDNNKHEVSIVFERSANGIVLKPARITGSRFTQGTIQEKYADFLVAYSEYLIARRVYDSRVKKLELEMFYDTMMSWLYFTVAGIKQGVAIYQQVSDYQEAGIKMALNSLEYFNTLNQEGAEAVEDAVPATVGAGLTVITSPRSFVEAAMSAIKVAGNNTTAASKMTLKNSLITSSIPGIALSYAFDEVNCWVDYYQQINSIVEGVRERASAVNEAESNLQASIVKMNMAVEAYNAEVAKGETCLAEREAARKVHANRIAQARYNDMFFRLQRNTALSRYSQSFALAQRYVFLAAQAYDYETALLSSDPAAGDAFKAKIVAARALGDFDADGQPIVASAGDAGLAGLLAQMDANWQALKPRLGINNPQNYATWFSLRRECFRILGDEKGDEAWAQELAKYWVEDIQSDANFIRYCQPFYSQYGLKDKEPGLIIPFETTIDFAKNLFGKDLAGGDATYDSTWYATRIAAAGLWFDGYNARADGYAGNVQLSTTPVAYLVPIGNDRMRVPGAEEGTILQFSVVDQVVPAPYAIGSSHLDNAAWVPSMLDGDYAGADSAARIRRHPSFRAYFDPAGGEPAETCLDATRLVGRSVWNTKWLLVIPAGAMNSDRDKALSVFIRGSDENRDGQLDLKPVSDIRIGFKTYSTSGN